MKYFKLGLVSMWCILVVACTTTHVVVRSADSTYIKRYNAKHNEALIATYAKRLSSEGVRIISVGQDYMLIIPADKLFYAYSPRIMWGSYTILNNVSDYLRIFKKVNVKVVAYSVGKHSEYNNQLLSLARAGNVANYLWSQQIDARLISADGYSAELILPNNCDLACRKAHVNARVEISFRNELK